MTKITERLFPRGNRARRVAWLACAAVALLLPLFVHQDYVIHVLITVGLYMILSLSLNLVSGYAGQLSIGHAAFYGIGAYTTALLTLKLGWPFWAALPASGLMTFIFGILLGMPTLRLRGDYLAIVTLGFGEIVRLVFLNWSSLTRGPMGLPGIPAPSLWGFDFSSKASFYYLLMFLLALTVVFMSRIGSSEFGMHLLAVNSDEVAAESVGVNVFWSKLLAFGLSSLFAGLAGSFYAVYISFISPDSFTFMDSITILAMVVLGGLASVPGVMIGAAFLGVIPEVLRFMSDYRMLLYGAVIVAMMVFRPTGFYGAQHRVRNSIMKSLKRRGLLKHRELSFDTRAAVTAAPPDVKPRGDETP
jgi:branched-chain amino acid transport system permease protein